jgi:hypothetical protein
MATNTKRITAIIISSFYATSMNLDTVLEWRGTRGWIPAHVGQNKRRVGGWVGGLVGVTAVE